MRSLNPGNAAPSGGPHRTARGSASPLQPYSPSPGTVYKGGTPGALGLNTYSKLVHLLSILCTSLVYQLRMALDRLGMEGMAGAKAGALL
jgi:hypothetical protein